MQANKSNLRVAIESMNFNMLKNEILKRAVVSDSGCWIWDKLDQKGYPVGPHKKALHRSVIEAKYGKRLGSQHAHHICANTACVNPDHLQPVTHRENIAEMLQRSSYLKRIAELEIRLSQLSPNDPLLDVISYEKTA